MATYINPLDLKNVFVSTFAGSWNTFLVFSVLAIAFLAARFRMNNIAFFMFIGLFGVMMATWIPWFYAFILVIVGFMAYFVISKIIKN